NDGPSASSRAEADAPSASSRAEADAPSASSRADGTVTEAGRTLARIWAETDLLVAECLRRGVWGELDAAGLAAAGSGGRVRAPAGDRRADRGAARAGRRRRGRDPENLVGIGRGRVGAWSAAHPGAGSRLRVADLPVGPRRGPGQGAGQRRGRGDVGRRLRAL